jgi:hypothetical protein
MALVLVARPLVLDAWALSLAVGLCVLNGGPRLLAERKVAIVGARYAFRMDGPPYRAMPQPPGPAREWRRIIELCLAVFNGLVVMALLLAYPYVAVYRHVAVALPEEMTHGVYARVAWTALPFPLLGLIGFLRPGPRGLRVFLTLPVGLLSLLSGLKLPASAARGYRYSVLCHLPHPSLWVDYTTALLLIAAGALTIEAAIARLRRR